MQPKSRTLAVFTIIAILLTIYIYNLLPLVTGWGPSSNYENVSVRTQVNVTQSYPEITNVTCNSVADITLNAGTTKEVSCLVEITDYNGGNTINSTNGTFYFSTVTSQTADDNNTHYTNLTCINTSYSGYNANWTCNFYILYYANNGTWYVNISVKDDFGLTTDTNTDYSAVILPMYALNVTNVIDFGNLAVGDYSSIVEANVTNFGNMDINISVYAFGGDNEVTGAGVAMLCDIRNISLNDERYALNNSEVHADMTAVTAVTVTLAELTIPQQTNDQQQEINQTYWSLYVDPVMNPFGMCNGTVVFAAEAP